MRAKLALKDFMVLLPAPINITTDLITSPASQRAYVFTFSYITLNPFLITNTLFQKFPILLNHPTFVIYLQEDLLMWVAMDYENIYWSFP